MLDTIGTLNFCIKMELVYIFFLFLPLSNLPATTGQQMMQTYDHAICDGQNPVLIKAATSLLNSENGLMISSSNGPIPEVESANMCHPNGGPRTIPEYQFFPEYCTAICSSSESIRRDGATGNLHVWNLHGGPRAIQEYHQFFPEKPGIHSEKINVRVDNNH